MKWNWIVSVISELKDPSTRPLFLETNERMGQMADWVYFMYFRLTLPIMVLSDSLVTIGNYFILKLGSESYFLFAPILYVLWDAQNRPITFIIHRIFFPFSFYFPKIAIQLENAARLWIGIIYRDHRWNSHNLYRNISAMSGYRIDLDNKIIHQRYYKYLEPTENGHKIDCVAKSFKTKTSVLQHCSWFLGCQTVKFGTIQFLLVFLEISFKITIKFF